MKRPITVIIPCKNEQDNIAACLESCLGIADELLIVDSGSTDATVEIAANYDSIRIIQQEFVSSSDFKNRAIRNAENEWIFVLHADERMTEELIEEIEMLLSRGPTADGYWIGRENYFLGQPLKWGDARSDQVMRLFRRDQAHFEESIEFEIVTIESGKEEKLESCLLHYGVSSYDEMFLKYHQRSLAQAEQWHESGKKTTIIKLFGCPVYRFIREYILQGGIFDGKPGLQMAWMSAFYAFTKQARLWELNHLLSKLDVEVEQPQVEADDSIQEIRRAA